MSNELNPNPLRDMDPAVREALGNKTRQVFSVLKVHYTQYHFVIKDDKQEAAMLQHWAKALLVGKVTEEMLRKGLEKAKANSIENSFCKWPSLTDFISWCHGMPSPEAAYMETARKCHDLTEWEPTHPIVALAGREVTFVAIRHNEDKKAYKAEYIRIYCELCLRVCNGETLTYTKPEKPKMLEQKPQTEREKAENLEALAELKAMIGQTEPEKKECLSLTEQEKQKTLAEMKIRLEKWQASKREK